MNDQPFDVAAALEKLAASAARSNLRPLVPEAKIQDGVVTVSLPPGADTVTLATTFAKLGLMLDDYEQEKVHYRQAGETAQLKIEYKPKAWRLRPARISGPTYEPAQVEHAEHGAKLVVFCGDQQAPYMDYLLHEGFLRWIEQARPSKIVNLGDLANFTSIGNGHRWNPKRTPRPMEDTQRCIDEGYIWWSEVSQAGSSCLEEKVWLEGNHEAHLVKAMIEAEEGRIYDVRRAGDPDGHGVMTIEHLCRLDELGVAYVTDELGGWPRGKYRVSKYVYARHGTQAKPGSGQSVAAALANIDYTLFVGHCHRGAIISKTVWDRDGNHRTIYGVEVPGMHALGRQGYESDDEPDQQQGFATTWIYPDGTFTPPVLASWIDGALRWGQMTIQKTARGWRVAA